MILFFIIITDRPAAETTNVFYFTIQDLSLIFHLIH